MESALRTDESWSTSNVAVLPRAGSLAVLVVASEAVDTLRPCPRAPWAPDLTLPLDLVVSVVGGEEEVSAVAEAVEAVVIDSVDLVEESATKEAATALVDRHPRTHLLDRAVDVVGLEEEEVVVVVASAETDSIVVLPVATASPSAPATATQTVTAAMTVTETVMATAIVTVTAVTTAVETASVATETVIGMAAERTMDASDTVRMTLVTMTRAPADDTKYSPHGYSPFLFSASFCWWVSLCLSRVPFFARVRG